MIYISAHKDFNLLLSNDTVEKLKDELSIIDGNELKNDYPINIIHETELNNDIYYAHDNWGELTRMHYIYKNIDKYDSDIIGFIQYRRMFMDDILVNHQQLLEKYKLICSPLEQQYGIFSKYGGYSCKEMQLAMQLINFF